MHEHWYSEQTTPLKFQPHFQQLVTFFPRFQVWQRSENYGRWLSAAVVNPETGVAATLPLVRKNRERSAPFTHVELSTIEAHLMVPGNDDLAGPVPQC